MAFIRPLLPMGKSEEVNKNIPLFLGKVVECIEAFNEGLKCFCEGDLEGAKEKAKKVDILESEADDIRRSIQKMLYAEGLLPSKLDKIELIEKVDDVADYAELAAWDMDMVAVKLPEKIKNNLLSIGNLLVDLAKALKICIGSLSIDVVRALEEVKNVNEKRNDVRKAIHELRREVFAEKLDVKTLTILVSLSHRIMRVADRAEVAADRVSVMAIKIA